MRRDEGRNVEMANAIERAEVGDTVRFAFAGDSGAWPDPTADAIFSTLVRQVARLDPPPAFFVNLGDFAGPGALERHEHYLELVEPLSIPNLCVVGNHDLDVADGPDNFARVHGPANLSFACGHTRFVALDGAPGVPGEVVIANPPEGIEGPRDEALRFLDDALRGASEPNRVVLMHMPPHLRGHYEPHPEWGFRQRESDFLQLLRDHGVGLVCCAHGLAFDYHVHDGGRFVMSGGGGTGICSHLGGLCTEGPGTPEDRGALFHAVEIAISPAGEVAGRVLQAFDDTGAYVRYFGDAPDEAGARRML